MNLSINTFRLEKRDSAKRNFLKFICKKNPSETNIQPDLISNISFNTNNKEKGNFINIKNNKIPKKPENINTNNNNKNNYNDFKSISEKQINSKYIKKDNYHNNNIIVIENLSQNEDYINHKNTNKEQNFINEKNTNSNSKKINYNINTNINNNNKIYDFDLNCEELFKKIENNINNFYKTQKEKREKFHKNSEHCEENEKKLQNKKENEEEGEILYENKNEKLKYKKRIEEELSNKEKEIKDIMEIDISSSIILSYKKILSNNKFYAKKILNDFLKKSENDVNNLTKIEENLESSVLYNIKSNQEDKENRINFNTKQNINNENVLNINDDLFSINKNLNSNINLDNISEEKMGNICPKNYQKIKIGFINSNLKAIYYEKINFELLSKILLDLSKYKNNKINK
jgi:hypothetical protein